jgi:hypothetical protein
VDERNRQGEYCTIVRLSVGAAQQEPGPHVLKSPMDSSVSPQPSRGSGGSNPHRPHPLPVGRRPSVHLPLDVDLDVTPQPNRQMIQASDPGSHSTRTGPPTDDHISTSSSTHRGSVLRPATSRRQTRTWRYLLRKAVEQNVPAGGS